MSRNRRIGRPGTCFLTSCELTVKFNCSKLIPPGPGGRIHAFRSVLNYSTWRVLSYFCHASLPSRSSRLDSPTQLSLRGHLPCGCYLVKYAVSKTKNSHRRNVNNSIFYSVCNRPRRCLEWLTMGENILLTYFGASEVRILAKNNN